MIHGGGAASRVRREARLPDGACGPAALLTALEPALLAAAGPDVACVSLSLEIAEAPGPGASLQVEAWVERATRTLVFAQAEASAGGRLAGAASAVFSRGEAAG